MSGGWGGEWRGGEVSWEGGEEGVGEGGEGGGYRVWR